MRHVNSLVHTTDVACMSGGGIGQIVNAIYHGEKHDEIIINAGTNEIVYSKSLDEFVYTIEKSLKKLQKLTYEYQVSFVLRHFQQIHRTIKQNQHTWKKR